MNMVRVRPSPITIKEGFIPPPGGGFIRRLTLEEVGMNNLYLHKADYAELHADRKGKLRVIYHVPHPKFQYSSVVTELEKLLEKKP